MKSRYMALAPGKKNTRRVAHDGSDLNSMQCIGLIVDMQVLAPQTRDTGRIYVSIKIPTNFQSQFQ